MTKDFAHALGILLCYVVQQRERHPEEDEYGLACAWEVVQKELETRGFAKADPHDSPTAMGEGS
jgi:hypothetical protein